MSDASVKKVFSGRPRPLAVDLNTNNGHFGVCAPIGRCGRPCSSAGQLAQLRGGVREQQILGRSRALPRLVAGRQRWHSATECS
jgi:hypothetical protein